jgi:transcriptional regulator with XRE-family HTH domain
MATAGERIREIREKKKLTQEQLATDVKISKSFLSDLENGKTDVSSEILLRIANRLGASVDYLLKGKISAAASKPEPVVIPPELLRAAEDLQLSFAEIRELLDAHNSVVARRSNRSRKRLSTEEWKKLHATIKKVFG